MCFHAEFGYSISNHMGIGWAQKLWDGGVADPLEIRPLTCATVPYVSILTEIPRKMGSAFQDRITRSSELTQIDLIPVTSSISDPPLVYRFRDKWRFRSKHANIFPQPVCLTPPLTVFPWAFGIPDVVFAKTRMPLYQKVE